MAIQWAICIFSLVGITICLECSYNIKCSSACLQRYCEYDPNTSTYNYANCCKGCIDQYYWVQSTQQCIQDTCSKTIFGVQTYWWFRNNTCVETCPVQYYFHGNLQMNPWISSDVTGRCGKVCPEGKYSFGIGNSSRTCISNCPSGYYKQTLNDSRFCTTSCYGQYEQSFLKLDTNQCTDCVNLTGYYRYYNYSNFTYTCSKTCPLNYTKYDQFGVGYCYYNLIGSTCLQPYIFDTQTNSCIYCQHYNSLYTLSSIADAAQCDRYCPVNYFLYPKANKCYADCNYILDGWPYYRDYIQKACVQIGQCSFKDKDNIQTFGDNKTGNCDDQCSVNSYGHPDIKICVADCFGNYPIKNTLTNMCESYQVVTSSTSDAITVTKSMAIIGAVIGVLVACVIAIIVVLIGYGIEKYCCKKYSQYLHIETQTPKYQHDKALNSLSSQFLQNLQIQTQNSPKNKKPRREPSFL